jgi:hypothetical protein
MFEEPPRTLANLLIHNRDSKLSLINCAQEAIDRCNLHQYQLSEGSDLLEAFMHITDIVEKEGAMLSLEGKELQYHNRAHFSDVVTCLSYFLKYSSRVPKSSALMALIAGVSHDLGHQGKTNKQLQVSQEELTASRVALELQDYLSETELVTLKRLIIGTDPQMVHDNHCRYLKDPLNIDLYLQVLINEADIFASLTPDLDLKLTKSLLEEKGKQSPSAHEINDLFVAFKSQAMISTEVANYFLSHDSSLS